MRQQTLDEIEQRAFEIVDAGGLQELSIAALATAMGISAPALYRYFPSRGALVEALVVAAYASLGSAVDRAARAARSHEPAEQVMAIAQAHRRWALAHPRRYSMLFSDRGPGQADPPAGIAAINAGMLALLAALQEISPADDGLAGGKLGQQLVRWGGKTGGDPDAGPGPSPATAPAHRSPAHCHRSSLEHRAQGPAGSDRAPPTTDRQTPEHGNEQRHRHRWPPGLCTGLEVGIECAAWPVSCGTGPAGRRSR